MYNPETNAITHEVDFPKMFQVAHLSSDGDIYILINQFQYNDGNVSHLYFLEHYSTKTKETKSYDLRYFLEPYPYVYNIYVDHIGRLWLDNVAFIDTEGQWHQIQRSPLFVSNSTEAYNDYKYKNAKVLLESSDNKLWYLHKNGMIYLDTEKSEWCWFTTYKSNIVEDTERNLWLVADGKLYRNSLIR